MRVHHKSNDQENFLDKSRTSSKIHVETRSLIATKKLRHTNFNWFVFVSVMEEIFRDAGSSSERLNQFLDDFSSKLPELGLSEEQVKLRQT